MKIIPTLVYLFVFLICGTLLVVNHEVIVQFVAVVVGFFSGVGLMLALDNLTRSTH
jgi:hypothetical protein